VPAELIASGSPTQKGHEFFSSVNGRVSVGAWDSTPYEEVKGPYSVDEVMLLLEGSLVIENEDGSTQTFNAGDAFLIPKGAVLAWKQSEYLRKYFFIHNNVDSAAAKPGLMAQLLDPMAALPPLGDQDPALYESEVPRMGMSIAYQDPAGKFVTGIWGCSPMKRVATTIERSELMHILEGSGSITNADGVVFDFQAGDTFLVPVGMGYQWQNHEYVKKIFCSYTP
jgi:uncharacterized cupin superfamily protein